MKGVGVLKKIALVTARNTIWHRLGTISAAKIQKSFETTKEKQKNDYRYD